MICRSETWQRFLPFWKRLRICVFSIRQHYELARSAEPPGECEKTIGSLTAHHSPKPAQRLPAKPQNFQRGLPPPWYCRFLTSLSRSLHTLFLRFICWLCRLITYLFHFRRHGGNRRKRQNAQFWVRWRVWAPSIFWNIPTYSVFRP